MHIGEFFFILLSVIFVNNYILSKFFGLCPFIGVSKQMKPAFGMGCAVTFVTTLSSLITWFIYQYALLPYHLEYMLIITFVLVIAGLVQLVEIILQKTSQSIYKALGIYLPLITTNCVVLGVTMLNVEQFFLHGNPVSFSLLKTIIQGFGAGVGFTMALVLMAGVRGRLELVDVPEAMQGVPIAFVIGGLMAISLAGLSGLAGL